MQFYVFGRFLTKMAGDFAPAAEEQRKKNSLKIIAHRGVVDINLGIAQGGGST